LDPFARAIAAIAAKRHRTEADLWEIARLEFLGSAWVDEAGCPCLPAMVVEGIIVAAAKTRKRGPLARSGVICTANAKLVYDGPSGIEALWEDPTFRLRIPVRTPGGRVMRTRPMVSEWKAEVVLSVLPTLVDVDTLETWLRIGGDQCGAGDFRPRYGRFAVERLPADETLGSASARFGRTRQVMVGHAPVSSAREGPQAPPSRPQRTRTSRASS
jgi:hypothetical protein